MTIFPIPDEALANHIALLGKTGSGKTSTTKLVVEHVVREDFRVCVLDAIKSDWWGITSSADGTRAGLPFKILGGPRGHVPLSSSAGKVVGQLVGSGQLPLSIIDMADFEPGGLQRFFNDFAPALMRHARGVLYLAIEEAHEFAPKERAGIGAENLAIHWAKKLATAGRSKGIRLIVATQRVQSLHNAVLGSCETLIAHRLTTPADQEPVIKWLKANTDKATLEAVAGSLSSLPTGTGWVCSGEAQVFRKVDFPKFATYDNTATPMADSDEVSVQTGPVDHDELLALIGDAAKEAEANDPKRLKLEVARLTKALADRPDAAPAWPDQREHVRLLLAEAEESAAVLDRLTASATELQRRQQAALAALTGESVDIPAAPLRQTRVIPTPAPVQRQPVAVREPRPSDGTVPAGCSKPLATLAAVYPSGLTEAQWSTAAGYKRSGGTWGTYKSRLRGTDLIELREGRWFATEVGAGAVGAVELPPSPGPDLVRWWTAKLPGTSKMAEALISAWPDGLSRDELAARVDMSPSGGSFGTYLSRLAGPGLIDRSGGLIRLTDEVMHG